MISVFDAETRLSIAARASADGKEVKATLEAVKSLDLKRCVVTADALHCHPKMAKAVRGRGGHYALKLKANNGPLHALAVTAFEKADARGRGAFADTSSSGHDRSERCRGDIIPVGKEANFLGLVAFGRIVNERRKARRGDDGGSLCRLVQAAGAAKVDRDRPRALERRE